MAGVGEGQPPLWVGGMTPLGLGESCSMGTLGLAGRLCWPWGQLALHLWQHQHREAREGQAGLKSSARVSNDHLGEGPLVHVGGHPIWVLDPRHPPPVGSGWAAALSSCE